MKFAVWLLVAAAVLSLLALLAGEMLPSGAMNSPISSFLGLGDPFRSWWFRILLGVLSLSLFVCVVERAPSLFRQAFLRTFRTDPGSLEGFPEYVKITATDGEKQANAVLKRLGLSIQKQATTTGVALSGTAGGLSRLGPLLSHLGMLLLIIGGLAVSLTGTSEQVSGFPGQVISAPEWGFQVRIDDFRIEYYPVGLNMWVETGDGRRGKVEMVRGDSARVSIGARTGSSGLWFPKSQLRTDFQISDESGSLSPFQGNVKSYISSVTVLEGERELYKKEVSVNSPLRERGYRFYQSSYQPHAAQTEVDTVVLHCEGDGGHTDLAVKTGGGKVALPWGGYEAEVSNFYADFRMDENFQPFSASPDLRNPAARVKLYKNGALLTQSWAFGGQTGHMGSAGAVNFEIADLRGLRNAPGGYTTILSVNRDKGGWLVWAGFLVMTLGLMLVYTMTQRMAWAVVVKRSDGRDDIHIAGASARDHERFKVLWERAIQEAIRK